MTSPLLFEDLGGGNISCTINLEMLFVNSKDMQSFNKRYRQFLASDENNPRILSRTGNTITYPHKSWLPEGKNGKPSLLLLFGNPAPHSVLKDIYFAYEGSGIEHRFWRVLRELGFTDMHGTDADIKSRFLNLSHESPFRLGFEVIYTFPSAASQPQWSGVAGLQRLFGKRAMAAITAIEKKRIKACVSRFLANDGAIIALQKDAYNAISQNRYNLQLAAEGSLASSHGDVPIYGTPPTRWLYTVKMKKLLLNIKNDLLTATRSNP